MNDHISYAGMHFVKYHSRIEKCQDTDASSQSSLHLLPSQQDSEALSSENSTTRDVPENIADTNDEMPIEDNTQNDGASDIKKKTEQIKHWYEVMRSLKSDPCFYEVNRLYENIFIIAIHNNADIEAAWNTADDNFREIEKVPDYIKEDDIIPGSLDLIFLSLLAGYLGTSLGECFALSDEMKEEYLVEFLSKTSPDDYDLTPDALFDEEEIPYSKFGIYEHCCLSYEEQKWLIDHPDYLKLYKENGGYLLSIGSHYSIWIQKNKGNINGKTTYTLSIILNALYLSYKYDEDYNERPARFINSISVNLKECNYLNIFYQKIVERVISREKASEGEYRLPKYHDKDTIYKRKDIHLKFNENDIFTDANVPTYLVSIIENENSSMKKKKRKKGWTVPIYKYGEINRATVSLNEEDKIIYIYRNIFETFKEFFTSVNVIRVISKNVEDDRWLWYFQGVDIYPKNE